MREFDRKIYLESSNFKFEFKFYIINCMTLQVNNFISPESWCYCGRVMSIICVYLTLNTMPGVQNYHKTSAIKSHAVYLDYVRLQINLLPKLFNNHTFLSLDYYYFLLLDFKIT